MPISPEQGGYYNCEPEPKPMLSPVSARRLVGVTACAAVVFATANGISQLERDESESIEVINNIEPEHRPTVFSDEFVEHEIDRFIAMHQTFQATQAIEQAQEDVTILREEPVIDELAPIIERTAQVHDIDPNFMTAIAWKESCGALDPGVSSAGALGIMQVMPDTAADMIEKNDIDEYNPNDPTDSVMMAATVISTNRDYYLPNMIEPSYLEDSSTATEILAVSYNWGIGGAQQFVESGFDRNVLPAETVDYLIEVEYLLEEEPESGEDTRCYGNPQTGK